MTKQLQVASPLDLLTAEIAMLRRDIALLGEDITRLFQVLDDAIARDT